MFLSPRTRYGTCGHQTPVTHPNLTARATSEGTGEPLLSRTTCRWRERCDSHRLLREVCRALQKQRESRGGQQSLLLYSFKIEINSHFIVLIPQASLMAIPSDSLIFQKCTRTPSWSDLHNYVLPLLTLAACSIFQPLVVYKIFAWPAF